MTVAGPAPAAGVPSAPALQLAGASSAASMGAYSQREFQFVEREARGELAFKYIKNDGDPQNMEWCALM